MPQIFPHIDPPFVFNDPDIAKFPPEVTGYRLIDSMRRRFGWESLAGKRLLDLGCGVRFARTIYNLGMDIGLYVGVEINPAPVAWFKENLSDPRFVFLHFDTKNFFYNPNGPQRHEGALVELGVPPVDAACMFSVSTHQTPPEAKLVYAQVRRVVSDGGRLYFTVFTHTDPVDHRELDEAHPGHKSSYSVPGMTALVESQGWRVDAVYPTDILQQTAFVCTAV